MRTASGDHYALDRSLASQARLGGAHVDAMLELEESFFPVGIDIVGYGGAACFDRFLQNFTHGRIKSAKLVAGDGMRAAPGTDAGAKERFVGIDVADSAEKFLIQQRALDGSL